MNGPATTCNVDHLGLPTPHPTYECCDRCNYADHRCPCCGDDLPHGAAICGEARAHTDRSVECAWPPCKNRLRRVGPPCMSGADHPQWCSKGHRALSETDGGPGDA